jgi:DNA-binding NarL/FixJ family response regulator
MIAQRRNGPEHRVMIVDDHEMVRRGIRSIIESLPGFMLCAETASGSEAGSLAAQAMPDIVVLDLGLPDGSGINLIRALKVVSATVQILVLTVSDSERAMAEAIEAGARGYVLKSEAGKQLAEALLALSRHRPYLSPGVSERLFGPRLFRSRLLPRPLTIREREIVRLVASGATNRGIAAMLDISIKTVESHRNAAMHKIGAKSAADVVRYALRNHMI